MSEDSGIEEEELLGEIRELNAKFVALSEDFTNLRHEVNELEQKIERRT